MAAQFTATLTEPDILKDSINAVSQLINEGTFKLTSSGMELNSMDSANVAMIDLKLLTTAFKEFQLSEDTEIGLSISDLTQVLKRCKSTDQVSLNLEDNQLKIEMNGKVKRSFNIPLLDIRNESKTPNLEFPAAINIKTSIIEDGISDAEIVSDALYLEADPDQLIIRAEGDSRRAEMKLEKDNEAINTFKVKDHVKSIFPLDYLKKMIKAGNLSENTSIHLGNDYPLKLNFTVVDKIQLEFILAPRIEND